VNDNVVFVSDFLLSDCQGGAEMVDDTIIKALKLSAVRTKDITNVDPYKLYLLSNTFQMAPYVKAIFRIYQNYVIFEHDYKIHPSRQPNLFPNNIIPETERINYEYYANARWVFLQSNDHEKCFIDNRVPGNFKNLHTSIWSKEEISLLKKYNRKDPTIDKVAIMDHYHPAKGKEQAVAYCVENKLDYEIIPKMPRDEFYKTLSKYKAFAYFPIVKESFCRVVVEAKCLGLDLHTTNTYGVTTENWFNKLSGLDMILHIEKGTKEALDQIQRAIL
jgi:hypothetical protein